MKIFEKKTKHHYVWAYYLREWSVDDKNIHYITKNGKIAFDSIRGLGLEKDFYKMGLLREEDREIITLITKDCNEVLKKLHWNFAEMVFKSQQIFMELSPTAQEKFGIDLNDIMMSNLFENYLSEQESYAIGMLNRLKTGDTLILSEDTGYYELCHFLGHQLARTNKMKKLIILALRATNGPRHLIDKLDDFYGRNWWFMCSFLATNLSYDMSLNKNREVFIIENKSNIEFITSDQPIININPQGHKAESVDYYYPLSPRRALLIITSGNSYFNPLSINENDVKMLNTQMSLNSCETIFGTRKEELIDNKKNFLSRQYIHFAQKYDNNGN